MRTLAVSLAAALCMGATAGEVRRGVWTGSDLTQLPLPVSGHQVYLVGEMHGLKEINSIVGGYLERLQHSGLRDVAIEEDSVYEREAQAYVEGKSDNLPADLCLRGGILETIRRLNEGRAADRMIRVHLVDIDSPASAIRRHLMFIRGLVTGGTKVRVPDDSAIKTRGLKTVEELKRLTADERLLGELRTIGHSIRAYQQGFEVGQGQSKGSPYLEDRESAIASNIRDVVRQDDCRGVLALYGSDHVSKTRRTDGGPGRDSDFAPMALRLQEAGVKVFSLLTFPLSGHWRWRGRQGEMFWTAQVGSFSSGETFDQVLAAAQQPPLLYVDPKLERVKLPSQDANKFGVDGILLIRRVTAMEDRCAVR